MSIPFSKIINKSLLHISCYLNGFRSDTNALPRIFIIGAQKAATSSLYQYLIKHPQIQEGKTKETHFFNLYYDKKKKYYKRQFPISDNFNIDATPVYLYDPTVPSKIVNTIGTDCKLIISLRDPIDRCYSAWNMYKDLATEEKVVQNFKKIEQKNKKIRLFSELYSKQFPDFESYVLKELDWIQNPSKEIEEPSFIRRGFYVDQIQYWLKYFPREQFFFMDSVCLLNKETALTTLQDLARFIGINPQFINLNQQGFFNKRNYQQDELSEDTKAKLQQLYQAKNKELQEITGIDFSWN